MAELMQLKPLFMGKNPNKQVFSIGMVLVRRWALEPRRRAASGRGIVNVVGKGAVNPGQE